MPHALAKITLKYPQIPSSPHNCRAPIAGSLPNEILRCTTRSKVRRVNHVEKRRALVLKRLQGRTTIMNMERVLCVRALRASYLRYVANMISSCECEPGSQWVSSGPTHPATNRTRVDVAGAAQPPPGCRYLYVILLF